MNMKKILRSVINVDSSLDQDDLQKNLYHLADSKLVFLKSEDQEIWDYVLDYARTYTEPPSINSVQDHFEKKNKLGVLDRIKKVKVVSKTYSGSNFENLVRQKLKDQNERETAQVIQDAGNILTNGLDIERGRSEQFYEGYKDALRYIIEESDELLMADTGEVFRTNIMTDAEQVRKDFRNTLSNAHNMKGRPCGLPNIDRINKGVKPGELWLHAGHVGELKCVSGSTKIFNHKTKRLERIDTLYQKTELPEVTAMYREGEKPELTCAEASHLVENGVKTVYRVTTETGRELEITNNHPLWAAKDGGSWQKLENLEEGDWVGLASKMDVPEPRTDFSNEEVKAIGYLLGDGMIQQDQLHFTSSHEEIRRDFENCLTGIGYQKGDADYKTPNFRLKTQKKGRAPTVAVSVSQGHGNSSMVSPLRMKLEELGLWGTNSHTKHVPDELFGLPEEQVELLLSALWSTDGCIYHGVHERKNCNTPSARTDIHYDSASKDLAKGVQKLLTRLGIQSSVGKVNATYKDDDRPYWTLKVVGVPSKELFCERLNIVGKQYQVEQVRKSLRDVDDRKFPAELINHLDYYDKVKSDKGDWRYAGHCQRYQSVRADVLRRFGDIDPDLGQQVDGDVEWDRIKKIEVKGEEMTYDLSVPEHHSFVIDGVITHNTTFALNWAYKTACIFRYNTYYYSLEMPVEQIRLILYVMHSNHPKFTSKGYEPLNYAEVRDGVDKNGQKISDQKIKFFNMVAKDLDEGFESGKYGSIFVECPNEPDTTIPMIKNRVELVHQNTPIHLVVIDYLGLVSAEKSRRSYREELNQIFRSAKQMCLTFNQGEKIPIVALHQINREGKKRADQNNGHYDSQALADSSAAERTADVITSTYLNDELKANNQVRIGCIKNRDNESFEAFDANVHFPSRYISHLKKQSGKVGF